MLHALPYDVLELVVERAGWRSACALARVCTACAEASRAVFPLSSVWLAVRLHRDLLIREPAALLRGPSHVLGERVPVDEQVARWLHTWADGCLAIERRRDTFALARAPAAAAAAADEDDDDVAEAERAEAERERELARVDAEARAAVLHQLGALYDWHAHDSFVDVVLALMKAFPTPSDSLSQHRCFELVSESVAARGTARYGDAEAVYMLINAVLLVNADQMRLRRDPDARRRAARSLAADSRVARDVVPVNVFVDALLPTIADQVPGADALLRAMHARVCERPLSGHRSNACLLQVAQAVWRKLDAALGAAHAHAGAERRAATLAALEQASTAWSEQERARHPPESGGGAGAPGAPGSRAAASSSPAQSRCAVM